MTVYVSKSEINLRDKLSQLDSVKGQAGLRVLASDSNDELHRAIGINHGPRNLVVNGSFQVWQRGNSFTNLDDFGPDRWTGWGTLPWASVSKSNDGGMEFTSDATNERLWEYRFEGHTSELMVGKDMVISIDAGSFSSNAKLFYFVYARDISGTWVWNTEPKAIEPGIRNVQTFTVPSHLEIDKVRIRLTTSPDAQTGTFHIKHVQMEYGNVPTPPEYPDYFTELARCQRYYWRIWSNGGASRIGLSGNFSSGSGTTYTTTTFPVPMRTTPSINWSNINALRLETLATSNNVVPTALAANAVTRGRRTSKLGNGEYDVAYQTIAVSAPASGGGNLLLRGTSNVDWFEFDAEIDVTDR